MRTTRRGGGATASRHRAAAAKSSTRSCGSTGTVSNLSRSPSDLGASSVESTPTAIRRKPGDETDARASQAGVDLPRDRRRVGHNDRSRRVASSWRAAVNVSDAETILQLTTPCRIGTPWLAQVLWSLLSLHSTVSILFAGRAILVVPNLPSGKLSVW